MTTQPVDDRYPEQWRPRGAPPFEDPEPETKLEPLAMELHIASLSDEEFSALTKRTRGGRA